MIRSRLAAVSAALLLTAALSAQSTVKIELARNTVEFGKAFALTVERRWPIGKTAPEWSTTELAPLHTRRTGVSRREIRGWVHEETRYLAHAFELGDVSIGEQTIRVSSSLDSARPGDIELPGEPLPLPGHWIERHAIGLTLLALALGLGGASWFVSQRVRRDRPRAAFDPAAAHARLQSLRACSDDRTFAIDASNLARELADAEALTTEEATDSADLDTARREPLERVLAHCDQIKFARGEPTSPNREQVLSAIEQLIETVAGAAKP